MSGREPRDVTELRSLKRVLPTPFHLIDPNIGRGPIEAGPFAKADPALWIWRIARTRRVHEAAPGAAALAAFLDSVKDHQGVYAACTWRLRHGERVLAFAEKCNGVPDIVWNAASIFFSLGSLGLSCEIEGCAEFLRRTQRMIFPLFLSPRPVMSR